MSTKSKIKSNSNLQLNPTPKRVTNAQKKANAKTTALTEPAEVENGSENSLNEPQSRAQGNANANSKTRKKKEKVYDSDALDEDSNSEDARSETESKPAKRKRQNTAALEPAVTTSTKAPRKRARVANSDGPKRRKVRDDTSDNDGDDDGGELDNGQRVLGKVVQAPKTGRVPPGQVSQNTLDFLTKLKDPTCNDRQWFKLHEPVYRLAEQEWKDFVEAFTDALIEVDDQIPPLPPKDLIYRIYRDVRFSNDKTPYKTGLSATTSRGGRKTLFAVYHISVKPGNESMIAAGLYCPGRNELANIRTNILRSSRRLRRVLSAPEFVKYFGEPKPQAKGEKSSIFGMEDELKVAPKGVAKDHPDIDLLKCRSFAVVHRFMDSEVLEPDFKDKLAEVARVMRPFVHCLNDYLTVSNDDNPSSSEGEEGGANVLTGAGFIENAASGSGAGPSGCFSNQDEVEDHPEISDEEEEEEEPQKGKAKAKRKTKEPAAISTTKGKLKLKPAGADAGTRLVKGKSTNGVTQASRKPVDGARGRRKGKKARAQEQDQDSDAMDED